MSSDTNFVSFTIDFLPYHTVKVNLLTDRTILLKYGLWVQTNLRMFMGATPSQVFVLGLNRSTEFRQLVPSLPPATYSMPSSTATPALLRRLSMLAMAVHVLLCSLKQETEHWSHVHSFIKCVCFCLHSQSILAADKLL